MLTGFIMAVMLLVTSSLLTKKLETRELSREYVRYTPAYYDALII